MRDISTEICQAGCEREDQTGMFSFDRAARLFWNGVYRQLRLEGKTDKQAKEWLASKSARYLLDKYGYHVERLGSQLRVAYREVGGK